MNGGTLALLCLIAALLAVALGVLLYIYYGRVIMRSRMAGAPLEWQRLLHMTFSGVNAYSVGTAYVDLQRAGVRVPLDALEAYARTHQNLLTQTRHLIESQKRNDIGESERILGELRGNRV